MTIALASLIVAIVGAAAGIVAIFPTALGWLEARHQREIVEGRQIRQRPIPIVSPLPLKSEARDKSAWRCGVYDYPPLSLWPSEFGGTPSGPFVELGTKVAEILGKSLTYELFSYDDFYKGDERIPDMVVGMFETKRRSKHALFSRPFYKIGLQGICRIDQRGDLLKGLREGTLSVAVYYGEVGWEFVEDELPDAVLQKHVAQLHGGHQLDTMHHLTAGKYDLVIMDHLACQNFLNRSNNKKKFKLAFTEPLEKFDVCIAVKPEHESYIRKINDAIVQVRNSDEFLSNETFALANFSQVVERRALRANTELKL